MNEVLHVIIHILGELEGDVQDALEKLRKIANDEAMKEDGTDNMADKQSDN